VSGDKLISDIVEVVADNLRLRATSNIIPDTLDQRSLPACGDGAEGIPCVAGDKAELGGLSPQFLLNIRVSLPRCASRRPR
jgi:hypothetical protein